MNSTEQGESMTQAELRHFLSDRCRRGVTLHYQLGTGEDRTASGIVEKVERQADPDAWYVEISAKPISLGGFGRVRTSHRIYLGQVRAAGAGAGQVMRPIS